MIPNPRLRLALLFLLAALLVLAPARGEEPAPKRTEGDLAMADGARIHYIEAGHGSAIVFIPGWTIPAEIWEPQIAHFSKSHHVVAFDPRSQGRSSKTADSGNPAARARDLESILDQLHLAPATLVCWSMAVSECLRYVDLFGTAKISALVLVDGFGGDAIPPERMAGMVKFIGGMQQDRRKFTEGFIRSMYRKPQSEEYLKKMIDASLATPADTAVALQVGILNQDNSKIFGKIDKPTLLAVATAGLMDFFKKMQAAIPGSKLEVFDAGHALFVDDADHFNQVMDDFLATVKPTGGGK
jgi:microsomal epoxide hydrolase